MTTLLIELKRERQYNPGELKEIQNLIRGLGAVSSQIHVKPNSTEISISLDSKNRGYLNPILPKIIERLNPTETTLNGRRMTGTKL